MQKIVVLLLFFVTFALSAAVHTVGVPTGLAIALGFLITGYAAMTVEQRLGRYPSMYGLPFMILGGLVGVVAATMAVPQVSGWIVGPAALLAEIAALFGLIKLYRVLVARGRIVGRRRLAHRRGWHYAPTAEVPVPGPRSAPQLLGVPNDAVATTGRDVIYADVDGFRVIMFDRVQAHERNAQVQSVWLVPLPLALPYLDFSALGYASAEDRAQVLHPDKPAVAAGLAVALQQVRGAEAPDAFTEDQAFARTLMAPPLRNTAIKVEKAFWLENAFLCAVDRSEERTGVAAREVERIIDALATFAAGIPWSQLAPYARQR
jgi:hypothetical protein